MLQQHPQTYTHYFEFLLCVGRMDAHCVLCSTCPGLFCFCFSYHGSSPGLKGEMPEMVQEQGLPAHLAVKNMHIRTVPSSNMKNTLRTQSF